MLSRLYSSLQTAPRFGQIQRRDVNKDTLLIDKALKGIYDEGLRTHNSEDISVGQWHLYDPQVDSLDDVTPTSSDDEGYVTYSIPARVRNPDGDYLDFTSTIYLEFAPNGIDQDYDAQPKVQAASPETSLETPDEETAPIESENATPESSAEPDAPASEPEPDEEKDPSDSVSD